MAIEPDVLKAALVWARNHIEVGIRPEMKDAIVQRLDAVLANTNPAVKNMEAFRTLFPERPVGRPKSSH